MLVIWLGDDGAADPASAGRKGASLAQLRAAGFDVPDGFVLTTVATDAIVAAGRIPEAIDHAIRTATRRMADSPLAVRSSGVTEDLPGASLAGQYETILDVRGSEAVERAILRCLASATSDRVKAYRAARVGGPTDSALQGGDPPFAIIVQRLVPADAAGVAFTADPMTGDRDVVRISAVRGLGNRLLGGASDGEEWVVRDDHPIEGRTPSPTPWPVARPAEPDPPGPRRVRMLPEPVLAPATVERIAAVGRRVEGAMGAPQDVEWALEGDRLWLLQARPITGLPTPPDGTLLAGHGWWSDLEHHARPLPAFAARIAVDAENTALDHAFRTFGFLRARSCYVAVGGVPFGRRILPAGLPPIGDGPAYARALASSPPVAERAPIAARALADRLPEQLVERWHATWSDDFIRRTAFLRRLELTDLDDEALSAALDASIEVYRAGGDAHFMTLLPYDLALHDLELACRELLGWGHGESLGLLAGSSASTSEPTRALEAVAERIGTVAAAVAVLDAGGAAVLERLREIDPEVGTALDDVLARFGDRLLDGDDPRSPSLAERPEVVVGLLRNLVHRVRTSGPRTAVTGVLAEERALAALADRPDGERARFERALRFARRAYETRDGTILWGCEMPMGAVRRFALEIGRRLVNRHAIGGLQDVFHLEPSELRSVFRGDRSDGPTIVARRRAEEAWVLSHLPPPEIGEIPALTYRTEALPDALRRIHAAVDWRSELEALPSKEAHDSDRVLAGAPGSPGRHTGTVRMIRGETDFGRVEPGDVIVCSTTAPAWGPLFGTAGALVTDLGDVLSHPAILAREHGIPAVLSTGVATQRLREGALVTVDGTAGLVTLEAG